jgi:hypothetical protein
MRRLFKDQEVKVFDNPQQLDFSVMRGSQAVAIGMAEETVTQ